MALAEGFEEDYAGGYAYVQGFYRAGGGQGDQEVAALAVKLNFLNGRKKLPGLDVFSLMQYDN